MNTVILIIFVISASIVSGFATAWRMRRATVPRNDFEKLTSEKSIIESKLEDVKKDHDKIAMELNALIADLRIKLEASRDKAAGMEYEKNINIQLNAKTEQLTKDLQSAREQNAALQTEKELLGKQHAENIKQIQTMQDAFKSQFENLGNKIFGEHSKAFKVESQTRLAEILSPLKADIDGFKTKLEESFKEQSKERHSLKSEIVGFMKISEQVSSQTNDLTKALKGDFRAQGNWGEVVLERILEESGLRLGEDYVLQGAELGMKHPETGQLLKPDVIVNLPENKHIVIDSKVSLTDYERYCSEEDEQMREGYLKQFLASVKKHVNDLELRRYQDVDQLKTPDFVLMFMPIEGAFSLAVQQDRELHNYAWGKKVVIVCPSILFATLRTISSMWRLELQHKHALEIARQGGHLYDKISNFVIDMQKLGSQLNTAQSTYTAAMNKLHEGRGNIVAKTQQLQALGAKASKNLLKIIPQAFEDDGEDVQPEQLHEINETENEG